MPHKPDFSWNREEVDSFGRLILLRDPSVWWRDSKSVEEQKQVNAEIEGAFLEAIRLEQDPPAYMDCFGAIRSASGVCLEGPSCEGEPGSDFLSLEALLENYNGEYRSWISDEVVAVRCPHPETACKIATKIRVVKSEQDSIGGTVTCVLSRVPPGLGEPCFDKLEAKLAHAMLSLPATKVENKKERKKEGKYFRFFIVCFDLC